MVKYQKFQKYKQYKQCFYLFLKGYLLLAFVFGWLPYLLYKMNVENPILYKSNWNKDMISDIIFIDGQNECPSQYEPLLSTYWPGIQDGCRNSNQLCYKYPKSTKCPKDCFYIEEVPGKTLTDFAFEQIDQKSQVQLSTFKICGQKLKGVNLYNSRTQKRLACGKNLKQCFVSGKYFCLNQDSDCLIDKIQCQPKEQLCNSEDRIACLPNFMICKDNYTFCSSYERVCQIKEYTVCVDKNKKCPITDILISSKLNQDKSLSGYEQIQIKQSSVYNLYVKRNDPQGYPVSDFRISGSNGVCLNYEEDSAFQAYILDKREKCLDEDIDEHYIELFHYKLQAQQVYEINQIDLGLHKDLIPSYDEYKIYYKHYLKYTNNCQSMLYEFDELYEKLDIIQTNIEFLPVFSSLILIFSLLIKQYFKKHRKSFYIYVYILILFISFLCMFIITLNIRVALDIDIYQTLHYYRVNNCFDGFTNYLIDRFYMNSQITAFSYEMAFLIYFIPGILCIPFSVAAIVILMKKK
ncbi:hypothetical protein ABPG72_021472 [Tetrahymena utriculariae]